MQKKITIDSKRHNLIVILLGCLAGFGPFTVDMYLPGFPSIARDFHEDIARIGLTLTSYFIGISMGQLIIGPMLDRYGRKGPIIIGLFIYIAAAIGCAFSQNIYHMIIGRFFLAAGVCVGMAGSSSIVRDIFKGREVARAMSLFGMIFATAPVIAPTVGGMVVAALGWRYVFAVLAVMGVLMLVAIRRMLPETKAPDATVSFRPKNVLMGYLEVIKNRQFVIFTLANMTSGIGLFTFIANSPFVFINLYGFTEAQFGWIYGANAVVLIIANKVNRTFLKKHDSIRILIFISTMLSVIGIIFLICIFMNFLPLALVLVLMAFYWFFLGFIPSNTGALALYPFSENIGRASALMGSIIMLAGALASALASYLHDGTSHPMLFVMSACAFISLALFVTGVRFISDKKFI